MNKTTYSFGPFDRPAVKTQDHHPCFPRVELLRDSTIGKYTFRLRFKYSANGKTCVCIVDTLAYSKKCAVDCIDVNVNLFPESINGYDLALLRFEPIHRSKFEPLFEQQNEFGLPIAA